MHKSRIDRINTCLAALWIGLILGLTGCAGTATMMGSKCFGDAAMCGSVTLEKQLMSDSLTESETALKKLAASSAEEKRALALRLSADLVDALAHSGKSESATPLGLVNDLAGEVINLAFSPLSLIGARSTHKKSEKNYQAIILKAPDALVSIATPAISAMAESLNERDAAEVRLLAEGHPPPVAAGNRDVVSDLSRARGAAGILNVLTAPDSSDSPRAAEQLGIKDKNAAAVANLFLTPDAPAVANIAYTDIEKQAMIAAFKGNDARITEVASDIFVRIGKGAIPALKDILRNMPMTQASTALGRETSLINVIATNALARIGPETEPTQTAEQHMATASQMIGRREFHEARRHLQQAEKMLPPEDRQRTTYYQRVGIIYFEERDFSKARAAFLDSIQLAKRLNIRDPGVADAYAGMGYCLIHEKKKSYAQRFLKKALESNPSPATHARVTRQLIKLTEEDPL